MHVSFYARIVGRNIMRCVSLFTLVLASIMILTSTAPHLSPRAAAIAQGDSGVFESGFTTAAPVIDGQFADGEWDAATIEPLSFFMIDLTTGEDTRFIPADLYLMNDHENLYIGLQIFGVPYNNEGVAGNGFDFVFFFFDNDNDGLIEPGEDLKAVVTAQANIDFAQRGTYADQHQPIPEEEDDASDLHIDGLGRIVHSNVRGIGHYTIELAVPLDSGDPLDIRTEPGGEIRFNIALATALGTAMAEAGAFFDLPFDQDASGWGLIKLQTGPIPPDRDPMLVGTITFITREFGDGQQLYVMNADGTNLRRRTRGDRIPGAPSLSPDGQKIVYVAEQPDDPETAEIFVLDVDRGRPRRLTRNGVAESHPVFSPDGEKIVFVREGNIWVMNANGRQERQLTDLGLDSDPVWTPDGRIVFTTLRWRDVPEIAIMDADGRHVQRLTDNEKGSLAPQVSPDGQWITFFRYDGPGSFLDFGVSIFYPWNIYRMRIDGTGEERLTGDGLINFLPTFSPDGRGILYQKILDIGSGYTVLSYLDLATGEDRRVFNLSRVSDFDWR